ncbi:hypothetical protein KXQ82_08250 [Mucilaginibacter sp. HMF5004]|uniref:hypothetical protein n=1 Tax=Mucilaginibacter rivuli TaxID=2857527 RepID=UPI001C602B0A|nr:hypothetical protein [Mucilaginibacter rivuli]MBW4889704.1 hypothetical protein [Mucilaginibacter rivuli]
MAQSISLSDTAFSAFHNGHYSQAINLYHQLIASEKKLRYHSSYSELMLSTCYTRLDSLEQAKKILTQIVSPEKPVTGYDLSLQENARGNLAEIYLKEKNFRKALYYYAMHDGAWSHAHFSDINQFEVNYYRAIALSKCYEGLKLKDSAVVVLTPYIFSTYRQLGYLFKFFPEPVNLKDSLKHDSVCMRYLTLLKHQYSNKNIKKELKKAEGSYQYIEDLKPTKNDSTYFEKSLTCKIQFYGSTITVANGSVLLRKNELESKKNFFFTKEQMLQQFRRLPLYRLITEL